MVSVASQLIQEVTAHAQRDSLEDVREVCADGTYFPNNLHTHCHILTDFLLHEGTTHFLFSSLHFVVKFSL
jgi:hypothetical protein